MTLAATVLACVERLRDLPNESAETGTEFVDVDAVLRIAADLEFAARNDSAAVSLAGGAYSSGLDSLRAMEAALPWAAIAAGLWESGQHHPKAVQNARDDLAMLQAGIQRLRSELGIT